MNRTFKWIAFIIGSYFATNIVNFVITCTPIFVGTWMMGQFGNFWFLIIFSLFLTIYYYLVSTVLLLYYSFIGGKSPDYWISNFFLIVTTVVFYILFAKNIKNAIDLKPEITWTFKLIVFFITIAPVYLRILYMSVVLPFLRRN